MRPISRWSRRSSPATDRQNSTTWPSAVSACSIIALAWSGLRSTSRNEKCGVCGASAARTSPSHAITSSKWVGAVQPVGLWCSTIGRMGGSFVAVGWASAYCSQMRASYRSTRNAIRGGGLPLVLDQRVEEQRLARGLDRVRIPA
jgi:hypothetical protein